MFCNAASVKMYTEIGKEADGPTNGWCTNERGRFADEYEMQTLRVDELSVGVRSLPDAQAPPRPGREQMRLVRLDRDWRRLRHGAVLK